MPAALHLNLILEFPPNKKNLMFFSADAPLWQGVQGGIRPPACRQGSLRNQENIVLPIHPPLIINLNDDEDDDDEEEENCKQFFSFFCKQVEWVSLTLAMYFTTGLLS